jgi:hypothetical protein
VGEKTPATTTTNQNSKTDPWTPATPMLQGLISQYSGLDTGVTPAQSSAASNLVNSSQNIPNMGPDAQAAIQQAFNLNTTPQIGMLGDAYNTYQKNIGGTASGAELDPYSTPGFSDAINTMKSDITNQVKGVYAGSGRSPSGAGSFAGSLARGLTQGIAPTIAGQYNTNKTNQMNAASSLFGGGGTTASGITGQELAPITAGMQGLQGAGMLSNLYQAPAQAQMSAANTQYGLPQSNLDQILKSAGYLGGLGSTTVGMGNTTSTPANNPLTNIMGGVLGGAGLLFSDRSMKEKIEEVGELHDGQKVYRFNMKGSKTPQIGLIAQEVAEHEPSAVHRIGDKLAVNYKTATEQAAQRAGMLRKAA